MAEIDNLTEFTQHIEAAVQAGQEPITLVETGPKVLLHVSPKDYGFTLFDLEKYDAHPRRKAGKPAFEDVQSFQRYLVRHKSAGTAIFLHDGAFHAVLDGHSSSDAGWGEHTADYTIKKTEPWGAWLSLHNRYLSQQDFATFVDARMGEIASPAGASLVEAVTNLTVKQNVDFQSNVNLTNGQVQFTYVENLENGGNGAQGQIRIPTAFALALVCYDGMPTEEVVGRLRWRFEKGKVSFSIDLGDEPRRVREAAEQQAITDITGNTGIDVWRGVA